MAKDLSTHRCQAKSAKSHDVTSNDSIRDETPCKRSETANSPTQPASTEETHQEKAQETYPWLKEFRSKGTKQNSIFVHVSSRRTRTIRGRGSNATPSLLVHISHAAIFPAKSKNEFLEY